MKIEKVLEILKADYTKKTKDFIILNEMYKAEIYGVSKEELKELEDKITALDIVLTYFSS